MVDFPHKIVLPQRPAHLVPRPRLTELLRASADRRLITISAPAGYGKTSLLIDFATTESALPVCWYTLDPFDQDPWVFLAYLAAAIEQRFPGATAQTARLLAGRSRTPFATAAAAFVRDVYAIGSDFVLIIDDWHLVDHVPDITELVAHLLLHCPNCHLILASRIYPSLPDLMLLAARRQMSGFDEEHIRFTAPEVAAVLGAEFQTTIPLERAQALAEQSNGWITGILLALQATGPAAPSLSPPDARAERQIYSFLTEQVFDQQTPEVRAFLLDSALLEELTPERCDAVFDRSDSGQILEMLLRHHIFITEINPGVLRYHPLFREFLQEHYRKIDPQRYRATARRVADAYAAQGQWPLAFESYITAGDLAGARRVVAASGEQLYTSGRLATLERWFAALPLDELDAPLLCLKARVLLDRGRHHEAEVLADLAAVRMQPDEEPVVLLLQSYLARIAGRYEHALDVAQTVLNIAKDPAQQASALRILATCHHRLGQSVSAIDELNQALAIERRRGDLYAMALLQHDLGVCSEESGRLSAAENYYSQAEAYWATIGNTGRRAMSLNSKGVVQHLAGRYREAHATLTVALQYAHDASVPQYQATVLASLGDLYSDLQLWEQAQEAYEDARRLGGTAYLASYLDLAIVRLLVRQRRYEAAARALERLPEPTTARQPAAVALLRSSIACGQGNYGQAMCDVQQAIALLERNNAQMDLARAFLLQAQIAAGAAPADRVALVAAIDHAAQIADQLGHDAFLVAETLHLPGLLRRAQSAGWERAADWAQRHHDLLLAAQSLRQDDQRPILTVRTLGTDQILLDGQPVEIGWLKAREVFYYLLTHPDGTTPEALREAIWPDLPPERSRGALKTAIYQLRSALPRELIELHNRQFYRINRQVARIDYDVERFLEILETGATDQEGLFEAIDLYRGPYLPSTDSLWSHSLRTLLEQRYIHVLRSAAGQCERHGAYQDALTLYTRILAEDPLDESAHAGVMRCQIALGNRAAAIGQYHALRRILDEELGLDPERTSEAEQLYHRILKAS